MSMSSVSASGIQAGLFRFSTAANDLANALTPGFRAARADQVDRRGGGTAIGSVTRSFSRGPVALAAGGFALAIQGPGFFRVQTPQGEAFTRAGTFGVDAAGAIVTPDGGVLAGAGTVPADATSILVAQDGRVLAVFPDGSVRQVGEIPLASFGNPGGLEELGASLFAAGPASGPPLPGAAGLVVFGALEGSDVSMAAESAELAFARAGVEANLAAQRAQDETLGELLDILG
jgi:flagellar basal-body rod protein FlgG